MGLIAITMDLVNLPDAWHQINMFQPPYPAHLTAMKAEKSHSFYVPDDKPEGKITKPEMRKRFGKLMLLASLLGEPITFLRAWNSFLLKITSHL